MFRALLGEQIKEFFIVADERQYFNQWRGVIVPETYRSNTIRSVLENVKLYKFHARQALTICYCRMRSQFITSRSACANKMLAYACKNTNPNPGGLVANMTFKT
jgi:hypothetical protein